MLVAEDEVSADRPLILAGDRAPARDGVAAPDKVGKVGGAARGEFKASIAARLLLVCSLLCGTGELYVDASGVAYADELGVGAGDTARLETPSLITPPFSAAVCLAIGSS